MICYFIFLVSKRFLTDNISKENIEYATAVIINEKNYNGNDRVKFTFTYSYLFYVHGKSFKGDSQNETLKIGDSIEIEYDKTNPNLNKPLHPTEWSKSLVLQMPQPLTNAKTYG